MSVLAPSVKGWCPGALRPMESGDGLVVRVRPRCGRLSIDEISVIADIAARDGNGLIDLTRRANVQVRGLSSDRLPRLWADLARHGLIDESAEAEAVRNVMVSPLAGLDPSVTVDVGGVVRDLEHALAHDAELWRLPGKFGFIVDAGGGLPLDGERADIRLRVFERAMALGLDRHEGIAWLGVVPPGAATEAAVQAARAFLAVRPAGRARMRELSEAGFQELRARVAPCLGPMPGKPSSQQATVSLGKIWSNGKLVAVGVAAPFGRVGASDLCTLATAAQRLGLSEFRLSPWRALYAPVEDEHAADALLEAAAESGFLLDASDPLARIDACPGASGCRSTALDTRAAARAIAPLLDKLGCASAHVSGCTKGCARSAPADLVLVGSADGFGLLRDATAQGTSRLFVPPAHLGELPDILSRQ